MGVEEPLRTQREELVIKHINAESANDVETALETFTIPRYDLRPLGGDVIEGVEQVRDLIAGFSTTLPSVTYVADKIHHADDAVIVEYRVNGTHDADYLGIPASGAKLDHPAIAIYQFDGPNLVGEKIYMNVQGLEAQLRGEAAS
jgi:steroid delta-isomerase-like uncharacterized protein